MITDKAIVMFLKGGWVLLLGFKGLSQNTHFVFLGDS